MSIKLCATLTASMLVMGLFSGCATTLTGAPVKAPVNASVKPATTINVPYEKPIIDTYGTSTPTFQTDNFSYRNNYLYINEYIPYSFAKSVNKYYVYTPLKFNTYVTPDGKPNALIYDSYNDALFITKAISSRQQVLSTQALAKKVPLPVNRAINALSKSYTLEKGPTREGMFYNSVRNRKQPFISTRYTLISKDFKPSVSTIRDQIMSGFYDFGVNPSIALGSRLGQHVFYVDVSIFSDGQPSSSIHTLFSVHGVNLNVKSAEYRWIDEHEPYITGMKFMQF